MMAGPQVKTRLRSAMRHEFESAYVDKLTLQDLTLLLCLVQLAELAVVPAVEKINNKPDQQPNDKAKPGFAG